MAELDSKLPRLLENTACVWYPFATHSGLAARVEGWLNVVRGRVRYGAICPAEQNDLCTLLDEMRLFKDCLLYTSSGETRHFTGAASTRQNRPAARWAQGGNALQCGPCKDCTSLPISRAAAAPVPGCWTPPPWAGPVPMRCAPPGCRPWGSCFMSFRPRRMALVG